MKKQDHPLRTRVTALLLALLCVLGLFPTTALAVGDTIRLTDFGMSGVAYQSDALGRCTLHQMYFSDGSNTVTGFCGTKGGGMGNSLKGQTWGNKSEISDSTVKTMMAYYYAHSTGVFTDEAKALSVDDVWDSGYTWYMNAWVQAVVWRYKEGSISDPVTSCAEEYLAVYNSLEGTSYTSIDEELDGRSFRDRVQYILDLGNQGVWGNCAVYEYNFTGTGSSGHPASTVQKIVLGELTVDSTDEDYVLVVKKVDSTNPNKGLSGAGFHVQSENGSFSQDVITGADGTYTLDKLNPGTYAITETIAPSGYEIDSTGPQYVTLPSNGSNTVTVTFMDTPPVTTSEGTIRKVDSDAPTKGLAGAVIKITGIDNSFTGTYVTVDGGYLTDVPWDTLPTGSFYAEEITPPEGYSLSPDPSKVKQTFVWDGKTEVALVFENDAKVKVRLIKLDDSDKPLPGAVFNIIKDGQIVGTEATGPDGTITVTDVTEGMYAFVEVSAPAPYATLREPVFAHVDQATVNGGGTVTVTASDKRLPSLTILKRDAQTGAVIPDTHFEVKGIHYGYHTDVTTGPDGTATLTGIPVDSYEVTEKSVPDPYVVGDEPTQTIWLEPGDNKQLVFDNMKQPLLKITKIEKGTGTPIPGTVFLIEAIDGDYRQNVTTEAGGSVELRVAPGSYRITEQSVPAPFVISDEPTKTISLNPGDKKEVVKDLLTGYAPRIAKAMKIPLSQFRWYAAFHDEGHHPHVHMVCYSADGKSGFLSKEGIAEIKSGLAKEIFRQELTEIYQRQTERRTALTQESQDVLRQLIARMRDGMLENPKIERLMLELADRLRGASGKKQYGYLKAPLKSIVDEIVDELEKDPRVAAAYDLWYQLREEVLRTYKNDLPERLPLSRQKEFKRIKNVVIEEAVKLGKETAVLSPEDGADELVSADDGPVPVESSPEQELPEAQDEAPPTVRWSKRYKEARRLLARDGDTPPDHEKAHALLLEEAQAGNALAMYDLGRVFADGIGTDVDKSQAQAWYAKALSAFQDVDVERPNRYAEYRVGWMLLHGIGSDRDETAARKWFEKSARSGNENAQYLLAKLILGDARSELEEISEAVDWLTELAEAGSAYAQYALGKLYRDGRPVEVNAVQAVIWFSQAAEQGHEYAMYAMGKMDLEVGNTTAALRWFQLAAEQGNQFAQFQLGKLLLQGDGVPKDVEEAVRQFTASAEQGNQYAQYAMGKLYLLGQDVPQDKDAAVRWFTLAAEQGNKYAQYFLDHINDSRWVSPLTSATRLLHHMSKIFRDETPPPSGGVSFVDSKLRRKIREKKIAMGHKPDDHEDQPVMSY